MAAANRAQYLLHLVGEESPDGIKYGIRRRDTRANERYARNSRYYRGRSQAPHAGSRDFAAAIPRSPCTSRARGLFLQGNRHDHVDPYRHGHVLALPCAPPIVFRADKFFARSLSVRCDFSDSLLQEYFDGELSARTAAEFEHHLRDCARCATELVDLDLLRDRLHLAQLYEPATASLRWRINARVHPIVPKSPASKPLLWHWMAAAAALLFIAIVLGKLG